MSELLHSGYKIRECYKMTAKNFPDVYSGEITWSAPFDFTSTSNPA